MLASGGSLAVITRNRRIELRPERDGTTTVVRTTKVKFPIGTRIEISFGPALPSDQAALSWAQMACHLAQGTTYGGRSSPWWYDLSQFHELLYASGDRPVRELIANLDGCTGAKAGEIVAAARTVPRHLQEGHPRASSKAVAGRARQCPPGEAGTARRGRTGCLPGRRLCHVVGGRQVRLDRAVGRNPVRGRGVGEQERAPDTDLIVCINRTPITGRDRGRPRQARHRRLRLRACAHHRTSTDRIAVQHRDQPHTPYMPITQRRQGTEPAALPGRDQRTPSSKVVRKAHRPTQRRAQSQKDIVLDNLDAVIADVSGDGEYRFDQRQLLYALRPIVRDEIGEELTDRQLQRTSSPTTRPSTAKFAGMYREPRGSIYHPHRGETITLGTLMVEEYERPAWTFNKLVYIEKEGFSRSAQGRALGRAPRLRADVVEGLLDPRRPRSGRQARRARRAGRRSSACTMPTPTGTMIYQTFQEATKARGARKIRIVNLGLEPWEAIEMGLEVETVEAGDRRKPVADYVLDATTRPDGEHWEEWLQTHRIELNAMTTPQFIEWLDGKMAAYHKLVPPPDVLEAELHERIENKVREAITERVLREANIDAQVAAALAEIEKPDADTLAEGIEQLFDEKPDAEWRDHIEAVAIELADEVEQ